MLRDRPRKRGRIGLLLAALLASGCSPAHYRRQADAEVYQTVAQAAHCGNTGAVPFTIAIDPASRMFDPNNPDCPPMPPDDPYSHRYMMCVDCKKGAKCWRCIARTPFVENPNWLDYLPADENGEIVLDMQAAVLMARLNSTNYQQQLEELYLSALDVTFERFRFDTQFFGGSATRFTSTGRDLTGTGSASSRLEVAPSDPLNRLRATRLTATGADMVIGLANSLVWQFSGPNDYRGTTLIDFSIVQPLLRAGGRIRVLERLTIAERTLLANVRQMERFRRGFYTEIVTGRDAGSGPGRRGGFFGGSGLEGFTGVGGGGFGRVGGTGGGGFAGGAGAARAGGYLGLLQEKQEIRNQRGNVIALRDNVAQFEAANEAGRIDRFQVELTRQALYNAESQLLTSEAGYQTSLDDFKINLGLPPGLPLRVEDTTLDRFMLLDDVLSELQNDVADALAEARVVDREGNLVQQNAGDLPIPPVEILRGVVGRFADLRLRAEQQIEEAEQDFVRLEEAVPRRRAHLQRLLARDEVVSGQVSPEAFEVSRLDRRVEVLKESLGKLRSQIQTSTARMQTVAENPPDDIKLLRSETIEVLSDLSGLLLELSLARASARLDAISIEPIQLDWEQALEIASLFRRDWMNARAALVDSWRLIFFNANDLLSFLDISFGGDLTNLNDNPFDLRDTSGRLRAGIEFDAPLTRLAERNIYRQALIEFQQARRQYYRFVDRVSQTLRQEIRQIDVNEVNFELRREAVHVAIAQVDLTQLRLQRPPLPGETSQFGDTTARDLVQSLTDLLSVQNDFLSVWVNYELQRLNLEFDLGLMEVDLEGVRLELGIPYRDFVRDVPPLADTEAVTPLPGDSARFGPPRKLPPLSEVLVPVEDPVPSP